MIKGHAEVQLREHVLLLKSHIRKFDYDKETFMDEFQLVLPELRATFSDVHSVHTDLKGPVFSADTLVTLALAHWTSHLSRMEASAA